MFQSIISLCKLLLTSNRAHSTIRRALDAWVCSHLILVVSNCGLCNWAYVALVCLEHVWVVGRKNRGGGTDNWAKSVVHLLGPGLLYGILECGAGGGLVALGGDGRVRVEVVVVVGCRAYNRALALYVSMLARKGSTLEYVQLDRPLRGR